MSRALLATLVLIASVFASGHAAAQTPPADSGDPLRVYVLVLDGLRPQEVTPELMPNLSFLRERGTWYEQARAVYVAETLPNHAAMMTGMLPGRNGIVSNDFWYPNPQSAQRFRMHEP